MIEWSWGEAIPAVYLRLLVFTIAVVAIYHFGPKMWGLMTRFRARNGPVEGEYGKALEEEVLPSNQGIILEELGLGDATDTAKVIFEHMKEERAKQKRRR